MVTGKRRRDAAPSRCRHGWSSAPKSCPALPGGSPGGTKNDPLVDPKKGNHVFFPWGISTYCIYKVYKWSYLVSARTQQRIKQISPVCGEWTAICGCHSRWNLNHASTAANLARCQISVNSNSQQQQDDKHWKPVLAKLFPTTLDSKTHHSSPKPY